MKDGTSTSRLEQLITRLEVLTLRLEALGMAPEPPPVDQKAQEAADKYIEKRKWELQGVEAFPE